MRSNRLTTIASLLFVGILFNSCYKEVVVSEEEGNSMAGVGLADWTEATHSGNAAPNYATVFDGDEVRRVDIVIDEEDWADMQKDLDDVQSGTSGNNFSDQTPMYVPCEFYYNNTQWYNVGIRYKGNSSLSTTYRSGNGKKPLRLEFDKFEDEYPEVEDQTFYGFEELSLSNNFDDQSLMREKMACELYRDFGVPAPHAAYYEVYIDHGDGSTYFGLYTFVEVVFNTMLEKQFGSNTGNCYKPDGDGAAFATSGFSLSDFEKKTNEDFQSWGDIQALYDALHANTRNTDLEKYKTNLEGVFDVDGFLRWLAACTTMQNWDTYGQMTHNYYLYHDPADDLIKWIPWDNNEAFQNGKREGAYGFDFSGLQASEWPLIGYLIDIPEYKSTYDTYITEFINGVFDPSAMQVRYERDYGVIESSATAEVSGYTFLSGSASFSSAVNTLISHCSSRKSAANSYLD